MFAGNKVSGGSKDSSYPFHQAHTICTRSHHGAIVRKNWKKHNNYNTYSFKLLDFNTIWRQLFSIVIVLLRLYYSILLINKDSVEWGSISKKRCLSKPSGSRHLIKLKIHLKSWGSVSGWYGVSIWMYVIRLEKRLSL